MAGQMQLVVCNRVCSAYFVQRHGRLNFCITVDMKRLGIVQYYCGAFAPGEVPLESDFRNREGASSRLLVECPLSVPTSGAW